MIKRNNEKKFIVFYLSFPKGNLIHFFSFRALARGDNLVMSPSGSASDNKG